VKIVLSEHRIQEAIHYSVTQYELRVLATEILESIIVWVLTEDAMVTLRSYIHEKLKVHNPIVYFWIWCKRVIQIEGTILSKLGQR
jgi:hypothetical protein